MSPIDLAEFEQAGFVRGPQLLDVAQLEQVRDAVARLLDASSAGMDRLLMYRSSGAGADRQVHVVGASLAEPAIAGLVRHPLLASWITRLLGCRQARFFRDQIFVKKPRSHGVVPWHQDYSDWTHTSPPTHITCWIALDDATPASGCLQYVRGRQIEVLPKITREDTLESALLRLPAEVRENFAPEPVDVPAGGCVFHHCLTIHGSAANTSAHPRRAIALAFMHPETRAIASRPVIPGGAAFPPGALIEGDLFPLIGDTHAS
ncbi:MAG: phytanoyl-CoA dioxygenase family protein [Bryobacterales bacterium]|nr:phytanoyl-CoA dioxygenase family protein [Bryobacterales bacterium]